MFWLKTKKNHIIEFEKQLAQELQGELPQITKAIQLSKVYGINFKHKPKGIYVTRGYKPKAYEELMRNHTTHFNLTGIAVLNKKTKTYEELKLNYLHDNLTNIDVVNPEYFHRNFDLSKIRIGKIEIENIEFNNPDLAIVKKVLKTLNSEQLKQLDLDGTFEIKLNDKLFYTILDMEDGNYIAATKNGQIFRLNHDHKSRVKQIAKSPKDFFEIYKGDKSTLESIMNE